MLTGPLLIVTFVISIVFLLVTIIKFNMNAFVSLLLTSVLTALLVQMPVEDISSTITAGFSSTVRWYWNCHRTWSYAGNVSF